ncbi:hypothetical protein BJX99DRAFT_257782 [Aspergillus californicus]
MAVRQQVPSGPLHGENKILSQYSGRSTPGSGLAAPVNGTAIPTRGSTTPLTIIESVNFTMAHSETPLGIGQALIPARTQLHPKEEVAAVTTRYGRIEILINNVGATATGDLSLSDEIRTPSTQAKGAVEFNCWPDIYTPLGESLKAAESLKANSQKEEYTPIMEYSCYQAMLSS